MVPIRDMETHEPLPGVDVGDIGPKLGYSTKDNGFLRLDHVRIPRENLLSRYGEVTDQGVYRPKGSPKVVYASMMVSRAYIINVAPRDMMQSLTIAIRYSISR